MGHLQRDTRGERGSAQTFQGITFASNSGEYTWGNEEVFERCGGAAKCVCNYRPSCQNAVINKQTRLEKLPSPVSAVVCRLRASVSFSCAWKLLSEPTASKEALKFTGQASLFLPSPFFPLPFFALVGCDWVRQPRIISEPIN